MSTRKIKDAKDLSTNELIYFKGHAKATYMSDGRNVEEAIHQISTSGGGGGITTETDPIFSASPAASITEAKKAEWDNKMNKVTLATVATSGSYNDLSNKPTIPSAVTESTVSGWGFTKNTGTYSKPSTGIPMTDLDATSQTLLNRASSAVLLEEANEMYVERRMSGDGSICANASVLETPDGMLVGLPSVGDACDDVIITRDTLKTVNGESLFGSGDITVSGGGGGDIIHFTEFNVDDFIEWCESEDVISDWIDEPLWDAMSNNKIICVPLSDFSGYEILYYQSDGGYNYYDNYMRLQRGGKEYLAYFDEDRMLYGGGVRNVNTQVIELSAGEIGDSYEEGILLQDNTIYNITGYIEYLYIQKGAHTLHQGSTIRFCPSYADIMIECDCEIKWVNDVPPVMRDGEVSEISLASYGENQLLGVITQFGT